MEFLRKLQFFYLIVNSIKEVLSFPSKIVKDENVERKNKNWLDSPAVQVTQMKFSRCKCTLWIQN